MAGIEFDGVNNKIELNTGAAAEDQHILFNGNAQDFYIGLDDSADDLLIGLGSTVGTTPIISVDENKDVAIPDGGLTITTSDNTIQLALVSTDADANVGPKLKLYRNSGSPADNDYLASIYMSYEDESGNEDTGFGIQGQLIEATHGSETARVYMETMLAGTVRNRLDFTATETIFNEDSVDLDFRVESNSNDHMFFVNGGENRVGIGTAPDLGGGLHIRTSDSGASVDANWDELVVENSGHCGISILTGTSSAVSYTHLTLPTIYSV